MNLLLAIWLLAPVQDVDLLKRIDPEKDAVFGEWKRDGDVLVGPTCPWARLQLPYLPPEEYDLTLEAELKGRAECLTVGLVGGGRQFGVTLNGWQGQSSGVQRLDDKEANQNETTYSGEVFRKDAPAVVVFAVRKDSLKVTVDGRSIIDWKAEYGRVKQDDRWAVRDERALYLACFDTEFRFKRVAVKEVTGKGRFESTEARRSRTVGGTGGATFEALPPAPGVLVGLHGWTSPYGNGMIVKALRPIFRCGTERREGEVLGKVSGTEWEVSARPGYAIGALVGRGGNRVDGFRIIFMKMTGTALDPKDRYESDWLGGTGGGAETAMGGDGRLVVGLHGRKWDDIDALGLVFGEVSREVLDPAAPILERLKDPKPEARAAACAALGALGPEAAAVPALAEVLSKDPEASVRRAAVEAIGKRGAEARTALDALRVALEDKDEAVRRASAEVLTRLGVAARTGLCLKLKKGDRFAVTVKSRLKSETDSLLGDGGGSRRELDLEYTMAWETVGSTDSGDLTLEGKCTQFKAAGVVRTRPKKDAPEREEKVDLDWDESKEPPPGEMARFIKSRPRVRVDLLGRFQGEPADPFNGQMLFAGAALSMPGMLPETEPAAGAGWEVRGGKMALPHVAVHRYAKKEPGEVIVESTLAPGGRGRAALEGSSRTVFDPKAGRPVRAEGKSSMKVPGFVSVEIEFTTEVR